MEILRIALREWPVTVLGGVCLGGVVRTYWNIFDAERQAKSQCEDGSIETPLSPYLTTLVDEVADHFLERMGATEFAKIRFYMSKRPDISNLGSTKTSSGSFIGIPVNFRFQNISEIDLSDWSSQSSAINTDDVLHTLKQSIVLTDIAKKFAIAQQIHAVDNYCMFAKFDVFVFGILGSQMVYLLRQYLVRQPLLTQLAAVVVIIVILTFIGVMFEQAVEAFKIRKADKLTVELGEEYMDGGIEFLEKELQRNKIMRQISAKDKEKYDETGEVTGFGPKVMLKLRLEAIRKMKEQSLLKEEEGINNNEQKQ